MKIVVKIGTQLITDGKGLLNHPFIESIAAQIIRLKKEKVDVIIVSSGAVGRQRLDQTPSYAEQNCPKASLSLDRTSEADGSL